MEEQNSWQELQLRWYYNDGNQCFVYSSDTELFHRNEIMQYLPDWLTTRPITWHANLSLLVLQLFNLILQLSLSAMKLTQFKRRPISNATFVYLTTQSITWHANLSWLELHYCQTSNCSWSCVLRSLITSPSSQITSFHELIASVKPLLGLCIDSFTWLVILT